MTKKQFEAIKAQYEKEREFWESLKKGDKVYSTNGWDIFEHTIHDVFVDECKALVIDHSQKDELFYTDDPSIGRIYKNIQEVQVMFDF